VLADLIEGDGRQKTLAGMRVTAVIMLRRLAAFRPQLIGSVMTGHIRQGSDIDIHVFTDAIAQVTTLLEDDGLAFTVQNKCIVKHGKRRMFTHIHVEDRFPVELTVYAADKANYPFKSSITGRTIERASLKQVERMVHEEHPTIDLEAAVEHTEEYVEAFELYRILLQSLESVKQSNRYHPEGDALYHSLQVFELARQERPYDAEFLLAALLHDVGKAIDPMDHVNAAMESLEDLVTDRTAFLIAHHMDAHRVKDGSLGARARRRLATSEDYEELMLLSELDAAGRKRGVVVCTVDEALDYVRSIGQTDC